MKKFKSILLQSILLLVIFIIGSIFYNFIDFDLIAEDLIRNYYLECFEEVQPYDCGGEISQLSNDLWIFVVLSHFLLFCVSFFWILLKEIINIKKLTKYILVIISSIANAVLCYVYFIDYNASIIDGDGLPMILYSSYYFIYNLIFLFIVTLIFRKKLK